MQAIEDTCRVCLGGQHLHPIFEKNRSEKIMYCASVQLSNDDELPKMICNQCLFYLDTAYVFRTVCEATDSKLRKILETKKSNCFFNNIPVANEVTIGGEENENEITLETKNKEKPQVGRHIAKNNSGRCPQRVLPDTTSKNILKCTICDKTFPYRSHLSRHMTVHSGVKKHFCTLCHKKFINRYNLSVHLRKHTADFALKCKICNRGFPSPSRLKRHLNSHSNPNLQCGYCPKKMLYQSSLKLHEKMHFYRPSYSCDICFKMFSYTNSLAEHKKIHQGVKAFVCEICCKKFSRKTSLRRHILSHSGKV